MATINISDLCPAGYDLLSDKESFLDKLSEEELDANKGGSITVTSTGPCAASLVSVVSAVYYAFTELR